MGSPTVPSTFRDLLLCLQRGGGWQGLSRPRTSAALSLLHSRACRNPWATQSVRGASRHGSQPSSTGEERRSLVLVPPTGLRSFPSSGQGAAHGGALCPALRSRENLQSLSLAAAYGERGGAAQKHHKEVRAESAETWPARCCVEGRRFWFVQKIC